MTVLDQLVFFAGLYGVPRDIAAREAKHWLTRLRVPEFADRRADELSKGNQQKVQFLAAILHDPQVLLMDEPFTGLDPVNVALLREACLEMRDRGKTLVFSTHQMETVEAMCESLVIVDRGRIVVGGSLRDVKRSTGRRIVRLSVEGDHRLEWLGVVRGARVVRRGVERTEIELDPGVEPDAVLAAAIAARGAGDAFRDRRTVARGGVHLARGAPRSRRHDAGARDGCRSIGRADRRCIGGTGRVTQSPPPLDAVPSDAPRSEPLYPNAARVARREYVERLRSRMFHVSTIVLAIFAILVAFGPLFARALDRETTTRVGVVASEDSLASGAIDVMSSVLNSSFAGAEGASPYEFQRVTSRDVAVQLVEAGQLDGAIVATRAPDGGIDFDFYTGDTLGADRTQFVSVGTLAVAILDWTANNTVTGRQFRMPTLDVVAASGPSAGGAPISGSDFAGRRIVAIVLLVLIFMMIVIYGMWVAAGVVAEKTSRVMELIVASASPRQLVVGKVLGIGVAGMTQYVLVLGCGIAAIAVEERIAEVAFGPGSGVAPSLAALDARTADRLRALLRPGLRALCADLRGRRVARGAPRGPADDRAAAVDRRDHRLPDGGAGADRERSRRTSASRRSCRSGAPS